MTRFPRTPPRLERIYRRDPIYFITCCTYRRRSLLADPKIQRAFVDFAQKADADFCITVGRYVILPDHLHFFVALPEDSNLGRWIGTLKRILSGAFEHTASQDPMWQRGFFDHVLRSTESYSQKWNYVRENPVRARLVKKADDWPYAGEIVAIDYD